MSRHFFARLTLAVAIAGAFASRAPAQDNPFLIDKTVPDVGVPITVDPSTNQKELGPVNGSTTKIGAINRAPTPMLEFTNPNAQVDLNAVWMQVRKGLVTDHQWLYFGWRRDSNSGSGFISIEFQQDGVSTGCVYTGETVDFVLPESTAEGTLINSCNPFRNRKTGDFVIMWDQTGGSLIAANDIKKRTFQCTGSGVPYTCTLGAVESIGTVVAAASDDLYRGEMAIDLTTDVFSTQSCQTFANVIPGTVTGNSDTADYKDTVFATFQPITNCGVLTVTKRTVDADGKTLVDPANPAPTFGYEIANGGSRLRYDVDAPDHAADGDAPQVEIDRPNLLGAPAIKGGQTQTHTDLIPSTNYTLVETSVAAAYGTAPLSIKCIDGTGTPAATTLSADLTAAGTTLEVVSGAFFTTGSYVKIGTEKLLVTAGGGTNTLTVERGQLGTSAAAHATGAAAATLPAHTLESPNLTFKVVVPDGIQQTDCVITNQYQKTTPTWLSAQGAKVKDSITLYGITPGGTGAPTSVTFKLYTDNLCTTQYGTTITATLTYSDDALHTGKKKAEASSGDVTVPGAGVYYWRIAYAGDQFNNSLTTACTDESVNIVFVEPSTPK